MAELIAKISMTKENIQDIVEGVYDKLSNPDKREGAEYQGEFDESTRMEGTFLTNGFVVRVNGNEINNVCRIQLDSRVHHQVIVIDSYGFKPIIKDDDTVYIFRLVLTLATSKNQ